jgi:triosephosphate isomerase
VSARRPLVAGNWKMHKTAAEATEYCARLLRLLPEPPPADVAACPPFTAVEATARALQGSPVWVAAQDVSDAERGAHTGQVSAEMIVAAGATGVIVGHSERRALGETDALVARKLRRALDAGLTVILCVGESLERREEGETEPWLTGQVLAALDEVRRPETERLAIAYEPIWAIGTGRTATPAVAQEACELIRRVARPALDADALRVLYGGSVTPENAGALMAQPDIDGALVGGASLDPESFASIVAAA